MLNMTLLPSAARTASIDSGDLRNDQHRGVHVVVDVTAITATPGLTVTIEGKDKTSGKYYPLVATLAAQIATVSTTVLKVYPGITVTANATASDVLPQTWRVTVTALDADSATYSIGACLIN